MEHNEPRRTLLIRVHEGVCPSINIRHALLLYPLFAHAHPGTGDSNGGHKDEVARLVETLALGLQPGRARRRTNLAKRNIWVKERHVLVTVVAHACRSQ